MTEIKETTVRKIAHAARINLSDEEFHSYSEALQNMFNLAEQLEREDSLGISQMAHPFEPASLTRDDVVHPEKDVDKFHRLTPYFSQGFYEVPAIIEEPS